MTDGPFRSIIEEVRQRTDLAALIGDDVGLRPAGSVLKGRSPQRPDKDPSLVVWPHSQTWRDFSGGGSEGGDCFDYVMRRDGIGFMEALRLLAANSGVNMPGASDPEIEKELEHLVERRRIEGLLTRAAEYYHRVLPTKIREDSYRDRYGFTDETVNELQLGWADGHLGQHLIEDLGASKEDALATGLLVRRANGELCDFFSDRLVFPYWKRGRVVYFIARATEHTGDEPWEKAKYKKLLTHSDRHPYVSRHVVNSTFYNEDAAQSADELLITEGVTDCISARQAGIACVSPVTVRFRHKDIPKLMELTRGVSRIVICNDAEESGAGEEGALETAGALQAEGRDVRVGVLPRPDDKNKMDINELVRDQGPDGLRTVLDSARRYPEFLIERVPADTPKADLGERLKPVVAVIRSCEPLLREACTDLLRDRFKLKAATLKALFKEPRRNAPRGSGRSTSLPDPGEGEETVKGQVYEETNHYYISGHQGEPVAISSFQIEPTQRIVLEDGEIIDGDVTAVSGRVFRNVRFPREAWHCKRNLLKVLGPVDLQFTGSDDNVQGVLALLSKRSVPSRRGTMNLGYCETPDGPMWVVPDRVVYPEGAAPPPTDILYVSSGDTLSKRIRFPLAADPDLVKRTASVVLPALLELNAAEVMLPIIGWFFASPLRPRIHKLLGHHPFLCIWGTPGSGKSSLIVEVFWPLLGVHSAEPYGATETEFAMLKLLSCTDSVPIFIDEYKPYDMPRHRKNSLHRFLRRLYTGEEEGRGRANQTVVAYRLAAPICLAGETRPIEAALVERMVSANPDKDELTRNPACTMAFARLKTIDLTVLTESIIAHLLGRDTAADVALARTVVDNALDDREVPLRFRDNMIAVVTGLICFEGYAERMEVSLPELDIDKFIRAQCDDLLESGGKAVKLGLDYFLEMLSSLAVSGQIQCGKQYYYSGDNLALHIPSCHAAYAEHCRRAGYEGEIVDKKALIRQIQENHRRGGYIAEVNKPTSFGSRADKRRATHIDMGCAKESLDVDDFPRTDSDDGSWGNWGKRWGDD